MRIALWCQTSAALAFAAGIAACSPAPADEADEAAVSDSAILAEGPEAVITELAAGDISEDEMLRARQPILESIEEARETNPWWLRVLSRAQREPDRLDEIRSMMEDYRTIGADEIDAAN